MFKLKEAHFTNFRLLRDLRISFSDDSEKKLTVIRAENESGKTTMIRALAWAVFGDEALPAKRNEIRLAPYDTISSSKETNVEIKVELDFTYDQTEYKLVRTTRELLSGRGADQTFTPEADEVFLQEKTSDGWKPINEPNGLLQSLLPTSLKDVFFMDGDRALVWIEALDAGPAKQKRVEGAVRSLLGLELLESAQRHTHATQLNLTRRLEKAGEGSGLGELAKEKLELEKQKTKKQESIVNLQKNHTAKAEIIEQMRRKRDEALAAGGGRSEELAKQLREAEQSQSKWETQIKTLTKQHRGWLHSSDLGNVLARKSLVNTHKILKKLEEDKVIPDVQPEAISMCLTKGKCLCGLALSENPKIAKRFQSELDNLADHKEVHQTLSNLYHKVATDAETETLNSWSEDFKLSFKSLKEAEDEVNSWGAKKKEIEIEIQKIPETDLKELNILLQSEETTANKIATSIGTAEAELNEVGRKLLRAETALKNADQKLAKVNEIMTTQNLAKDVELVLENTLNELKEGKRELVSTRMNEMFLEMIAADPEFSAITGASLESDYDIIAFGSEGQRLNLANDLNGASRRCLTMAFILALTEVSGANAPSVVDTPIGMMSGAVKYNTVEVCCNNSHQLILFLTRSEILGVEELLEKYGGVHNTLTTTFNQNLKNPQDTENHATLICSCKFDTSCKQCEMR